MRVGLVRNVGLSITALAVLALGGCDSNPLSFDVKDTVGIQVNPSEMVVAAGRTADLESRAVNQGNEPTFDAVSAAVDPVCGLGSVTVVPDPDALEIQPPGLFVVTGGSVLGQTCIVLTSGSNTAQVDVTVVADDIEITAPLDGAEFEAGATGQVVAQLIGLDGAVAGPYAPEDAVFTSSDTDVLSFTDDMGNFTTTTSGTATVTVTWAGQDLNGTSGLGVVVSDEITVTVVAGDPVTAAFANSVLGAFVVGDVDEFEVFVSDAEGNINTNEDEILGVTVASSDPLIATATGAIVTGSAHVIVTVEAIGGGTAAISGTVQTTNGDLPFTAAYPVVAPSITSLSAPAGGFAETITITGTGLSVAGLATLVLVDGEQLGNFTVDSDTQITAQMPTYAVAGTHNVVVSVAGVESTELITWNQTNACYANDYPPVAGYDGPIVDGSIPMRCNGTAFDTSVADTWFHGVISEDALAGAASVSVHYAPTWGAPLKDIDWFYCGDAGVAGPPWGSCVFEIDQPPATVHLDLGVGDHAFIMDDYAAWVNGDFTIQDYTIILTID